MTGRTRSGSYRPAVTAVLCSVVILASVGALAAFSGTGRAGPEPDPEAVLRGRGLVMEYACGGCHGGGSNPAAENWLIGATTPEEEFRIGPCDPEAEDSPCFVTRPRNLTPDNITGLGRFTERQIFNALRYGLRPGETADAEITSTVPGEGNFPEHPKYLAPPMPWPAWRHMPDEDLWAIAAYLKHGLKPVRNRVQDSEGPPDFWASAYTEAEIGPYPAHPFPTARELEPADPAVRAAVLRGRQVVIRHDCGGCHGGGPDPASDGWLAGITSPDEDFLIGPCAMDPEATPCLHTRPRNLTPDDETGLGAISERQIFNALRFGLVPASAPDAEITSTTPGEGHFPEAPRFLGAGMPWEAWRHMSDQDLMAVAAYLKHGLKPVSNHVPESDHPPDFWASEYTVEKIGAWPAPAFPTENEVAPQ